MPFRSRPRYSIRSIPALVGGLNDADYPTEVADNEIVDCENIEVSESNIKSAPGYVDYGGSSSDGPYWGGINAVFSSGTNRMIRQRINMLEYDNGLGTWTTCTLPTTGSPAAAVSLSQVHASFAMLNDVIFFSNGVNNCMSSTDGITWTDRGYLPKSKQLFNNGLNRILFVNHSDSPSKIGWSAINNGLSYNSSTDYQAISFNDGESLEQCVLTPSGGMIAFKTNHFFSISDVTQGLVAVDPLGEAPCFGNTVCATENSVIWFGGDAVYEYMNGATNRISDNLSFAGRLKIKYPYLATATYFNKKYRLSVPLADSPYNFQEFVIDRTVLTGKPNNPYAIIRNGRFIGCYIKEHRNVSNVRRNRLYLGSSLGTSAYRMFSYLNDDRDQTVTQGVNGSNQTCYFITKFYNEENPYFIKRYTKFFIDTILTDNFSIKVSYRFNESGGWTDVTKGFETQTLEMLDDNNNSIEFDEGFGFYTVSSTQIFVDLETDENVRGVQFKLEWSLDSDVTINSLAYRFLTRLSFR